MYIIAKFYMDSKLPLKEALDILRQDGRFDIKIINDNKIAINGIVLDLTKLTCKNIDKCLERILDKYKYAVEMPLEVLPVEDDVVEELLGMYPELGAFGKQWLKKWGRLKDRMIEIGEALRRFSWMVDVITQRPVSDPHPHLVEVYVALDESETCLLLNRKKAFCNGREASLVLTFAGYDVYDEKIREIYRCCGRRFAKIL